MPQDLSNIYNFCIENGVLVVFSETEGIAYYGEVYEEDEVEDTLNELCEQGTLCTNAFLVKERTITIAEIINKFNLLKKI